MLDLLKRVRLNGPAAGLLIIPSIALLSLLLHFPTMWPSKITDTFPAQGKANKFSDPCYGIRQVYPSANQPLPKGKELLIE